jgi:UDP:flavonoid glycosyltransferase YjiC (YdhE family)
MAPLDWGLGHCSRSVPIIKHLQAAGHQVYLAATPWQRDYMFSCLGPLPYIPLQGYGINYKLVPASVRLSIMLQLPKLLAAITYEKKWLSDLLAQEHFDAVISDNRYGLHHPALKSFIICHQLHLRSGLGTLPDVLIQKLHYRYLSKFNHCLVPDAALAPGLGAALSHSHPLPLNTSYLGPLSQFSSSSAADSPFTAGPVLILLSGPEPHRTHLSDLLWNQLGNIGLNVIFVEGSTHCPDRTHIPPNIQYHKQLGTTALLPMLQQAYLLICRSGYSTIMDLVAMRKRAILIPTPGQTEQEYLAQYHQKQGHFMAYPQQGFSLNQALKEAAIFPFKQVLPTDAFHRHKEVLDLLLQ